jgi:hypothetical protein
VVKKSYVLGTVPSDPWFEISKIIADINANVPNWTATQLDTSGPGGTCSRRASALQAHGFGNTNGWTNQPVTATPLQLDAWFDHHCDVVQLFTDGSGSLRSNGLHRGNLVVGMADSGVQNQGQKVYLMDAPTNDFVVTEFAVQSNDGITQHFVANTFSHFVFRNSTILPDTVLNSAARGDAYCVFEQCILTDVGWSDANGALPFTFKDCYLSYAFPSTAAPNDFSRAPSSGNTQIAGHTSPAPADLLQSPATGDFRPKAATPTKTSVSGYDALGNPRTAVDAIGAFSLSQVAALAYPF